MNTLAGNAIAATELAPTRPSPTARRRKRANPGDGSRLREEILIAAEQLLTDHGTEDVLAVRTVAAAAGISTPSVYLHFSDKDELVGAVAERVWEQLRGDLNEALASTPDPFRGLRRLAVAYLLFARRHPVQYRLLLMRAASDDGAASTHPPTAQRRSADLVLDYILRATQPCVDLGVLRGDTHYLGLRLWSALHGAAALRISHPHLTWPDDEVQVASDIARMAGLGIAVTGRVDDRPRSADRLRDAFDALESSLATPDPDEHPRDISGPRNLPTVPHSMLATS